MSDEIDYSIHYRRWHDESEAHFAQVSRQLDIWLGPSISHIPKDARVLDYGCGFGLLTSFLLSRFPHATGVDASLQQVGVARSRGLPVDHVSIPAFSAWANDHRESFDVIFLMDVLEHVPPMEQIKFLRRLVTTLRPQGEIYIKVPNASSLLASRWRYIDWTHLSSFTEASLEFVCHHAGLEGFIPLDDDSSPPVRWRWLPRWGLRHYYVKQTTRWFWRLYIRSEIGSDEKGVRLGLNLMIKAKKRA